MRGSLIDSGHRRWVKASAARDTGIAGFDWGWGLMRTVGSFVLKWLPVSLYVTIVSADFGECNTGGWVCSELDKIG